MIKAVFKLRTAMVFDQGQEIYVNDEKELSTMGITNHVTVTKIETENKTKNGGKI